MKKVAVIITLAIGLSSCATKTIIKEVVSSTTTPVVTTPVTNKYEDYLSFVSSQSSLTQYEPVQDMYRLADTICLSLDSGRTILQISTTLSQTATTNDQLTFYAATMYGAIKYICPEYMSDLNAYLNT